ncbi:hypothetical protein ABVT39_003788 [Epinephelus coioides]
MDTKMIKLRLFIHQRLYSAAEEILGEVEKTITLALCQPEVSRSEEEAGSLRHQRDIRRKKAAAEPSLTGSTVERSNKCDAPSAAQEELNFCTEVSRPSYTSADLDNNTYLMSEIKGEPEELGNCSRTQKIFFPSPEIVKSEQVQPEIPVSYELQPLSSDCSAAQSENNDSDEELMKSKREQTKTVKRKGRILQAAEEILGEVEKTITLALYEAEVSRPKEEAGSLRRLLDLQRKKAAAEPSLTSSTVDHGNECENPGPSTPEESNFRLSPEAPGPSQTSTDLDSNNWNYCLVQTDFKMSQIKEEQEELGDNSQTQEMVFVKSEQDEPETRVSYEMLPLSSDCSAVQSGNNDSDEEVVKSTGEQTKIMKRKGRILQGQSESIHTPVWKAAKSLLTSYSTEQQRFSSPCQHELIQIDSEAEID